MGSAAVLELERRLHLGSIPGTIQLADARGDMLDSAVGVELQQQEDGDLMLAASPLWLTPLHPQAGLLRKAAVTLRATLALRVDPLRCRQLRSLDLESLERAIERPFAPPENGSEFQEPTELAA